MNQEALIKTLKEHYPRDIRKQLIKTMISNEKSNDKEALKQQYNLINQIFSYVLKECNWSMPANSNKLDSKPLLIIAKVFPKLDTTKWYQQQLLIAKQKIDVVMGNENSTK